MHMVCPSTDAFETTARQTGEFTISKQRVGIATRVAKEGDKSDSTGIGVSSWREPFERTMGVSRKGHYRAFASLSKF